MSTRTAIAAKAAVLGIIAAVALAGCSGTSADQSVSAESIAIGAPDAAGGGVALPPDAAVGTSGIGTTDTSTQPQTIDRQVVRTAYVAIQVDDVAKAAFAIHGLVAKNNGTISNEQTQASGDATSSMITAQVPSAGLDAFIAEVSKLGTVDSVTVTADDVTTQVVDLDARIKALQTSIDRMTQLLAAASKIDDLLAIETQLSTRQAELDSLTAQRRYLGTQVAMSTVTIAVSPVYTVQPVDGPGFLTGLQNGWAAFVSVIVIGITALGFLLPFILVGLAVVLPIVYFAVRHSRRAQRGAVNPVPAVTLSPAVTPSPADGNQPAPTDDRAPTSTPT